MNLFCQKGSLMIERPAVRAIIIDPTNALLLVHIKNGSIRAPSESFWITPGGAIEPNEKPREALIRELYEETGIEEHTIEKLYEPAAWYSELVLTYKGAPTLFKESFFLIKIRERTSVSYEQNPDEHEKKLISELRWWTPEELMASQELFFPVGLPQLVTELINNPTRETIMLQNRK